MNIIYSKHLKARLVVRKLEYNLPLKIYEQAKERYWDNETRHMIAVMKVNIYGKEKETMVAYIEDKSMVKLLTIHPLKSGQKGNRLKTGRWRKLS